MAFNPFDPSKPLRPVQNPDTEYWLPGVANSLLNGYIGSRATGRATDSMLRSGAQANALSKYMYDTTRQDNLPALEASRFGLTGYGNLLRNPLSLTSEPGYQFELQQGRAAFDNSGAFRGMRLSGGQAKAMTRWGQNYGQSKFDQSLNRFGNLAGIGQLGGQTIASAGTNYANTAGANLTGMGNAQAAGYIGNANNIASAVTGANGAYQEAGYTQALIEWLRKMQQGG